MRISTNKDLNGMSPDQLDKHIRKFPVGFSTENNGIQFLGKSVKLKEGKAYLAAANREDHASNSMLERLITLNKDIQQQLPDSIYEAMKQAAVELVNNFGHKAVENTLLRPLKYAVAVEYISQDFMNFYWVKDHIRSNFNDDEKCAILDMLQKIHPDKVKYPFFQDLEICGPKRFDFVKELFKRPEDSALLSCLLSSYISSGYGSGLVPWDDSHTFDKGIKQVQQILEMEAPELGAQLMTELQAIREQYDRYKKTDGTLEIIHQNKLIQSSDILLYYVAASANLSKDASPRELGSYIRNTLQEKAKFGLLHIAREMAFLAKQPESMGYSYYIKAVSTILNNPSFSVTQNRKNEQLSDIRSFALLESDKPLTAYLSVLENDIQHLIPKYKAVFQPEIKKISNLLKNSDAPGNEVADSDKTAIRQRVHRLLGIVAACSGNEVTLEPSALAPFVKAIMAHGNKRNIPYLISGLGCLVKSPVVIQKLLCNDNIKGGDHARLAPLGLLRLYTDKQCLSTEDFEAVINNLQKNTVSRGKIKDGKVLHQWLVTLDKMLSYNKLDNVNVGHALSRLTSEMSQFYAKLGWVDLELTLQRESQEQKNTTGFYDLMGLNQDQARDILATLCDQGGNVFSNGAGRFSKWLWKQRDPQYFPIYFQKICNADKSDLSGEEDRSELISCIKQFVDSIETGSYITSRQSSDMNPHLTAVYRKRPDLEKGWQANFAGFSEELNAQLSSGERLELSENPWDLFISGLEVKTCQSPDGDVDLNRALMSYVMDGRNAMIVKKNSKGIIIERAVLRIGLNSKEEPVLFLEKPYVLKEGRVGLFMESAREIAQHMKLPLYSQQNIEGEDIDLEKNITEPLTFKESRAPFDYFDCLGNHQAITRKEVVAKAVQIELENY